MTFEEKLNLIASHVVSLNEYLEDLRKRIPKSEEERIDVAGRIKTKEQQLADEVAELNRLADMRGYRVRGDS